MSKGTLALAGIAAAALVAAVPVGAASASSRAPVQHVGLVLLSGDRVLDANFAVAPGIPVRVTVTNYTRQFHTFTVPALHVSNMIVAARGDGPATTTFTFTPHAWGSFAWHCLICPSGAHGRPHQMGGTIYAIIDPSAVS